MKPKDMEKALHEDGKLHVVYNGPTGGLKVAGMLFPNGVMTRLSPTKVDLLKDEDWAVLQVVRPEK